MSGSAALETNPDGPAARVAGFMRHLRLNGFATGPAETTAALRILRQAGAPDQHAARLGLKALLAGDREQWERFDDHFESYWFHRGRTRVRRRNARSVGSHGRPNHWAGHLSSGDQSAPGLLAAAATGSVRDGDGETTGKLAASRRDIQMKTDLRGLVGPEDLAEAERVAETLARAIRYRLSRRRLAARRGEGIDLRRTLRRNLSRGAEPLDLVMRRRPTRPANLVLMVDVSGSMNLYARVFLAFVRGLLGQSLHADAFLFHTRLARVTEAFMEPDALRAMARLSLLAEGFGGGTRIAASLGEFNDRYAKSAINSRSVVMVMSDGYDTDPPEALAAELARLKTRARRLVWLNPLLGWQDYTPTARGMAAALPFVDLFAAATTLEDLAALESELAGL